MIRIVEKSEAMKILLPSTLQKGAPPRVRKSWYVYQIHDNATGELLYVGRTVYPWKRMRHHHHANRYRMDQTTFTVSVALSEFVAEWRERDQIQRLDPRDNINLR